MTQNQFAEVCLQHLIDPDLALENPDIVEAIGRDNIGAVKKLLETDF